MFRMIFASISELFNVVRITASSANRLAMIGHVRCSSLLLEELQAAGDIANLEQQLRDLGLSEIAEIPKPAARATTARAAKQ